MTQDNNEEIALTTDVGSDGDLLVEQFLGFAKKDIGINQQPITKFQPIRALLTITNLLIFISISKMVQHLLMVLMVRPMNRY